MKKALAVASAFFGAPGAIRTHGLSLRGRMLYPAELQAHIVLHIFLFAGKNSF